MTRVPQTAAESMQASSQQGTANRTATAGMVLGIVCVSTSWVWFALAVPIVTGIVGAVLSVIGCRKSEQCGGAGSGMAAAGLICSAVGLVVAGISLIVMLVLLGSAIQSFPGFVQAVLDAVEQFRSSQ